MNNGGALVIFDPKNRFYPPAAAAWGIDLSNTIVLRNVEANEMLWAIDQSLRSVAVAAVWGNLDEVQNNIDERWLRRFQLSAEDSGTVGLFVRGDRSRQLPSWSEIQWLVEPGPQSPLRDSQAVARKHSQPDKTHRYFRLHLLRCRGGLNGKSIRLKIDMQSGQITRHQRVHTPRHQLNQTSASARGQWNRNKPDEAIGLA